MSLNITNVLSSDDKNIINDDKNWHPESELFGGMRKTQKILKIILYF
jgi:hypothetical protein